MRIHLWAATLVLAACLPNTVQAQTAAATAPVETVRATPAVTTLASSATPAVLCGVTLATLPLSSAEGSFLDFGKSSLVRNGGPCTSDAARVHERLMRVLTGL